MHHQKERTCVEGQVIPNGKKAEELKRRDNRKKKGAREWEICQERKKDCQFLR